MPRPGRSWQWREAQSSQLSHFSPLLKAAKDGEEKDRKKIARKQAAIFMGEQASEDGTGFRNLSYLSGRFQ